ncbi:MAG: LytTR family DNA-binding domain-containing protein [Bacteroidota bacterium]
MDVLIIEDEAPAFRRLQQLLTELDAGIRIVEVIDSVRDAVAWLNTHPMPDLIFMDIQLADGVSFSIFDQVTISRPVIFTTAYDEYTLQAFKVNSIDYLLKPLSREDLERSLAKLADMKRAFSDEPAQNIKDLLQTLQPESSTHRSRFLVKQGQRLVSIPVEDIAYFFARDGLIFLRTVKDNKYLVDFTLDDLAQELDPKEFFRLNRQVMASYRCIKDVHYYFKGKLKVELTPAFSEEVIISREKAPAVKKWLGV